ncbi:MAG: FAD-binding oxidoreductase [Actinobacteria bacterium]|nr:FAD-binding oxidoreductase [Actinomycetota bacterium]
MKLPDALRRAGIVGVLVEDSDLERYSRDASPFRIRPQAVVRATDEADVARTIAVCREARVPLTPRSGGTGLAGQSIGAGVILDTGGLPATIEVRQDGESVTATASATVDAVNDALAPYGRRLGPDLTSADRARVGGIIGTNACGAGSNHFGRTADGLLEVTFLDGTGVERTLQRVEPHEGEARVRPVRRGAAGFAGEDARALCGSEGTLGVVTSAIFSSVPVGVAAVGVLAFQDVRAATEAVPMILEHDPYAVELMDRLSLRSAWPNDPAALLVVEMHEESEALAEAAFWELAVPGAIVDTGLDASAREAAWRLRRSVLAELAPADGRRPVALIEDASVPVERLGELVAGVDAMAARWNVEIVHYGHAAAGTLHLRPLLDLSRGDHVRAAVALVADHADLVLSLGGAISSEHGLGLARTWLVERAFPSSVVEGWRRLKAELDPDGILNPGRVIPDRETFPAELLAP